LDFFPQRENSQLHWNALGFFECCPVMQNPFMHTIPTSSPLEFVSAWSLSPGPMAATQQPDPMSTPQPSASLPLSSATPAAESDLLARINSALTSLSTPLSNHSSPTLLIASRNHSPASLHPLSFLSHPWRFTVYLSLLFTIRGLLRTNTTATKHDIYYRSRKLFRTQVTVDKAIDDLAATFGVARAQLHVVATEKGVVVGAVTLQVGGRMVDCQVPTLIPSGAGVTLGEGVKWVLWVEKEAVFHRIFTQMQGDAVVVTGKGYPVSRRTKNQG
jgi:hypothetical protein